MLKEFMGKKIGMTQVFNELGGLEPVTIIEAGPCSVVQIKTEEKDGYEAVQIGYGRLKNRNKPMSGHLAGIENGKHLQEVDVDDITAYEVGQEILVDTFQVGEKVTVTGRSKGRGFSGVIKRHNFARQKKTHGTGHTERSPGSIGQASDPSRVFPGMKMAGRYGNSNVSVENLKIIKIDKDNNYIMVKGAVPGARNGVIMVSK